MAGSVTSFLQSYGSLSITCVIANGEVLSIGKPQKQVIQCSLLMYKKRRDFGFFIYHVCRYDHATTTGSFSMKDVFM